MKILDFDIALDKSTKRFTIEKNKKAYYFQSSIKQLFNYVQAHSKSKTTEEDIENLLMQKVSDLTEYSKKNLRIFPYVARFNAARYLSEHPQELEKVLESIKNLPYNEDSIEYGRSFEEDCKNLALEIREAFNTTMENYKKTNPIDIEYMETHSVKDLKKVFNRMSVIQRKNYLTVMGYVKQGLPAYLKDFLPSLEKDCKGLLIDAIRSSIGHLNDLGLTDNYIDFHNKQISTMQPQNLLNITAEDLLLNPKEDFIKALKSETPTTSLENSSLAKFLEKQSLENLIFMNTFWINRLEKETEDFSNSIFYASKLNLFSNWKNGVLGLNQYSDKDITNLLIGTNLLFYPVSRFYQVNFSKVKQIPSSQEKNLKRESDKKDSFVLIDTSDLMKSVSKSWNGRYEEFFNSRFPNMQTSLQNDISLYLSIYNPVFLQYAHKDRNIQSALIVLLNNTKQNYGLSSINNASQITQKKLPISIDTDLNFPIRFHVSTELLKDILQNYNNTSLLKLYLGTEDFIKANGRFATTQILAPFSNAQSKYLKKASSSISKADTAFNFIEHLNYLRDNKHFPEHLKVPYVKPNGKVEMVIPEYYIDLNTGEIYQKDLKTGNLFINSEKTKSENSLEEK